jgi:hypothetical protein
METDSSQSHCRFKYHTESYFPNLIPFLPLFCNCQFRRLDSVQFLCSQTHIPAGCGPETGLSTPWLLFSTHSLQSQSHIATDGQSVSKSWCRVPSGAHDQILIITVWQLLYCFFDERTGLSFVYAAGPCQRSLSGVRVPNRDHILLSQIWDFPFRRLLRLAASRWRYSTPPPHGVPSLLLIVSFYNHSVRTTQKTQPLLLRTRVYLSLS